MSVEEYRQNISDLKSGMALAEYNMLREKAMRNETLIQSDGQGGTVELSAREVFEQLYHEPAPTFQDSNPNPSQAPSRPQDPQANPMVQQTVAASETAESPAAGSPNAEPETKASFFIPSAPFTPEQPVADPMAHPGYSIHED